MDSMREEEFEMLAPIVTPSPNAWKPIPRAARAATLDVTPAKISEGAVLVFSLIDVFRFEYSSSPRSETTLAAKSTGRTTWVTRAVPVGALKPWLTSKRAASPMMSRKNQNMMPADTAERRVSVFDALFLLKLRILGVKAPA